MYRCKKRRKGMKEGAFNIGRKYLLKRTLVILTFPLAPFSIRRQHPAGSAAGQGSSRHVTGERPFGIYFRLEIRNVLRRHALHITPRTTCHALTAWCALRIFNRQHCSGFRVWGHVCTSWRAPMLIQDIPQVLKASVLAHYKYPTCYYALNKTIGLRTVRVTPPSNHIVE